MFDTYSTFLISRAEQASNSTNLENNGLLPESPYGYKPNLGAGVFFLLLFGLSTVIHCGQSIFYRRWFLLYTVVLSGILEVAGWYGRVWSSQDVLKSTPYMIQIVCTIIAPTPLLAANFVIFGRIIRRLGTTYSRLRPRLYTKIFFSCDVIALIVQAAGGTIASGDSKPKNILDLGTHVMLAGIIFQLIIITCFSVLACDFWRRYSRDKPLRSLKDSDETPRGFMGRKLQLLLYALITNTSVLYIRAIYRTAELADGFQGKIITTEWLFIVFDALMVFLAMFIYNIFHVGRLMESEDEFKFHLKLPNNSSSETNVNLMYMPKGDLSDNLKGRSMV
ncbi:RTA1-domain-containing protein [Dendrothele bispora CBS 962.96]|uniref:RTA1-domain-containing protein n=1 Tax=Dendrothele bispora (strain CBS 962.96) TaxID=1314807 RepID=A0A4S8LA11_DENBC|nr:RTA1-domain-containing protein [Dendrothele bispora CBS 962.96]